MFYIIPESSLRGWTTFFPVPELGIDRLSYPASGKAGEKEVKKEMRKIVFFVLAGLLVLAACAPAPATPTPLPTIEGIVVAFTQNGFHDSPWSPPPATETPPPTPGLAERLNETKSGDTVSLADPNAPSIILFTEDGIWACAVTHCAGGFWTDGRADSPSMPRAILFYNFSVEPERYEVATIEGDFEQARWDNALEVLGTRFIGTPLAEYKGEWIADIADIQMLVDAEDLCFTGNGLSPVGICTTP